MSESRRLGHVSLYSCIIALVSVLAGCAGVPSEPEKGPAPDAEARQLAAAGRHKEAAETWQRLASQARSKDTAQLYRLNAAESLLSSGDAAAARKLQGDVQARGVPSNLRLKSDIITARLSLAENRPEQALAALGGTYPEQTPRADRWQSQLVRADAQLRLKRPLEAAKERSLAERYGAGDSDLAGNRFAIWDTLGRVPVRALTEGRPPPPDPFGGWMELAALQRQYGRDPAALTRAVDGWRKRYPGHPAELDLVPELLDVARARGGLPNHIAIILPDSGPFAAPGRAVREGFTAAWFGQGTSGGGGPRVSFYDVNPETLEGVLEKAVDDGADFVVGPLDKVSVTRLAATASALPVPVLALNRADGALANPPSPGAARGELYQFALAPEDEARDVARRARADGRTRAALLYPDSEWGERVAAAFRETWGGLGGSVAVEARYGSQPDTMVNAVRSVLRPVGVAREAEVGVGGLRDAQGPSARFDADFIFLAAFPAQARQLRPQITYQNAGGLPIYATSHVYTGIADPRQDQDLEGIIFADMPWVLYPSQVEPGMQRTFEQNWRDLRDGYNRLFAFGVDAYRLLPHLTRLRAAPGLAVEGVTGRLKVDSGDRVVREVSWAQFRNGVPTPIGGPMGGP